MSKVRGKSTIGSCFSLALASSVACLHKKIDLVDRVARPRDIANRLVNAVPTSVHVKGWPVLEHEYDVGHARAQRVEDFHVVLVEALYYGLQLVHAT